MDMHRNGLLPVKKHAGGNHGSGALCAGIRGKDHAGYENE